MCIDQYYRRLRCLVLVTYRLIICRKVCYVEKHISAEKVIYYIEKSYFREKESTCNHEVLM